MKSRKWICLLLTVCMAVGLLGGAVFAATQFTDVPEGVYYTKAVDWAVTKGVTSGTSATTFSPNATCTRAEMVTFLWRLAGRPAAAGSTQFQDVRPGAYYYDAVRWAAQNNVTSGVSATRFDPDGTITRAQAVSLIYRYAGAPAVNGFIPFNDVPVTAYYANAVTWGRQNGVVAGTGDGSTFSPNDPCTRGQIVTFLYRFSERDARYPVTKYPVVLVHGLLGWGAYDDLNPYIPYWGMTATNVVQNLRGEGVEVYAASVGPISSAWDRACELYAQLTGTVTDYGAKHALEHGHDRFGRDYTGNVKYSRLLDGPWDAQHPINLVGHSFGGATSRLLLDLLADGSAEEQAYMKAHPSEGAISPLFTGGKADWVYSLTALAAPSNGTTFIECNDGFTNFVAELCQVLSRVLGPTPFKGIYDFQLEHFGLQPNPGDDMLAAFMRAINSGMLDHNDNAYQDLTIDKALYINNDIQMQPNVYYFSYYGNRTYYDAAEGVYKPTNRMQILATPFSTNMGKYIGTTVGEFQDGYGDYLKTIKVKPTTTDASWQPNDGLVNVPSAMWPARWVNGAWVADPHTNGTVGMTATQKGIWYVMPEQSADHLTFMGSIFNETEADVMEIFDGVIANIVNCGG